MGTLLGCLQVVLGPKTPNIKYCNLGFFSFLYIRALVTFGANELVHMCGGHVINKKIKNKKYIYVYLKIKQRKKLNGYLLICTSPMTKAQFMQQPASLVHNNALSSLHTVLS